VALDDLFDLFHFGRRGADADDVSLDTEQPEQR
jgi:hypothetical protein